MARTYGPGGEMKKRKKGEPFNSKGQTQSRLSQFIGPRVDTHLPSQGPGSLLDRRDTDFIRQQREQHERRPGRGYESDLEYGLVKKKKKSKKRTA